MTWENHPHLKESSSLEKPSPPFTSKPQGTYSDNQSLSAGTAEVGRAPHIPELLLAATAEGCQEPGARRRADCT